MTEPMWGDKVKTYCKICDEEHFNQDSDEYNKHIFKAPRCVECNHRDPDYICISNDGKGIKIACKWCKVESMK